MTELIRTERMHFCTAHVWHGEEWFDRLPQMLDPLSGDPYDLTDVTLHLILRVADGHATKFATLSSDNGGIRKENAAEGKCAIYYSQSNVEANLPFSPPSGWWQGFRIVWTDPTLGPVKKWLWAGPLHVYPARDS